MAKFLCLECAARCAFRLGDVAVPTQIADGVARLSEKDCVIGLLSTPEINWTAEDSGFANHLFKALHRSGALSELGDIATPRPALRSKS